LNSVQKRKLEERGSQSRRSAKQEIEPTHHQKNSSLILPPKMHIEIKNLKDQTVSSNEKKHTANFPLRR
jgi:hypothetical protein